MGWQEIVLLFAGGVLAGCINVLAGGAGFMTFPLLVAAGMSEIEANASNFVALLPANIASLYGYRHELRRPTLMLGPRLVLAGIGGALGSLGLIVAVALRDIITRKLTIDVPTMIVALGNSVIVMASGLALYPFEGWITPGPRHLVLLLCGGLFLSLGYICMVHTIRMGGIAPTAIYRYSVVLFALISGAFVFHEFPDQWALIGIALIVASGIYALLREMKASRKALQP